MHFKPITDDHLKVLQGIFPNDRISTGISNLEIHSRDQSHHPSIKPEVVVWPVTSHEVMDVMNLARDNHIPLTPWGMGTSLEGNPIPVNRGIVMDFSKMNRVIDIREKDFQATVEPGLVYQDLNSMLRHTGLFFAPDPGAHATIGGMIANNASGIRSVKYGSTRENLLKAKIVLPNGEIITVGSHAVKTSSGYDLLDLFTGSEGTLGIVVEATIRLRGIPEKTAAALISFPSVNDAAEAVFQIICSGLEPAALELMDDNCITLIRQVYPSLNLSEISPSLFVEFHGSLDGQLRESMLMLQEIGRETRAKTFIEGLKPDQKNLLLKARYRLGENMRTKYPDRTHIVMDAAVPISSFPELISYADQEASSTGIPFFIFGHAGEGNIHLAFMGKTGDREEWAAIEKVNEKVVQKALDLEGTATGEHGIGLGKIRFLYREHGSSMDWMVRIKDLFDPKGILNPGKIFPPSIHTREKPIG